MWTLVDDADNVIQVRASLNTKLQQDELRKLIAALEKRLTKEPHDDRPATTDV
jgi:F0F1-type ATP synthase delta subunit